MAALAKQLLWVGFLKVSAADFGGRDLRSNGEHRRARAVTVEQPVDQVQVARPATTGADRQLARQVRFRTRGESGNLLMPNMNPLDLALATQLVGQTVKTVANDAVYPLDTRCSENFHELIGNGFCHVSLPRGDED